MDVFIAEHLLDQVPPRSQKKLCMDDRLSDLPDTILHHIMSLLSAQEVARTCILSKRWKELSASAPCLDICVDKFGMDRVRFSEFVAHLLLSRAPNSLHTFRLHSFAIDHASSWINRAIELKAQVLEFTEYIRWESFYLDPQLMAFASQYLKCLKLTNVTLDSNAFEPLNHACPALENLQLSQCFLEVPEICSASLKKLDIMECSLLMNLQIQTPRLVSLRFRCLQYKCSSCSRYPVITAAVTLCDLPNAENIDLSCSGRQVWLWWCFHPLYILFAWIISVKTAFICCIFFVCLQGYIWQRNSKVPDVWQINKHLSWWMVSFWQVLSIILPPSTLTWT